MDKCNACKFSDDTQEPSLAEKYPKLFSELEHSTESEQKQKIEEMREIMEVMHREDFQSVFTKELFDKIDKMMEEEKLSMENAILLLKHVGYNKVLKKILLYSFDYSSLSKRMKEMIIDENEKKKEEKNEKLLVDL
ncbi:uncharacterized protein MONOS_7979 [Monocercomonoides exilis]|uniref:uncharacterized protein n=1 Tax=Monocercomonoides exilis TaxID=2049356 RepID=UPI003559C97C|nr:hypothetical protein MONOS_7979 [Monocercomonoides exilis]|eukprot:MONOS_7979.1-p1 / transcript=MONOS_7979.1 / gene=MONOS_7979 / organism=Monocercomonoides_exilis_PA203 / gene_product=unspecified product / transcript_product=unspecified product / location=Mono_scaffold00289:15876-16346(-) / protein_length=136 / sequence_SO=supercontig / SO=protein_coding / is_pseudo=false